MSSQEGFDLSNRNTFALKSVAKRAFVYENEGDVDGLVKAAAPEREGNLSPRIIGAGSNLILPPVVEDLVILVKNDQFGVLTHERIKTHPFADEVGEDDVVLEVGGGHPWIDLVRRVTAIGLWGIENLAHIPGTAGGAVVQNIGAYGFEMRESLVGVVCVDTHTGARWYKTNGDCHFGYRHSLFKKFEYDHLLIEKIHLKLSKRPHPRLEYKGVAEKVMSMLPEDARAEFASWQGLPREDNPVEQRSISPLSEHPKLEKLITSALVMEAITAIRNEKLPDPKVTPNAGSFFKNPVVDGDEVERLKKMDPSMPVHKDEHGEGFKLSAAWLIDKTGLKGLKVGGAMVSEKHPLIFVNAGGATYDDVQGLEAAVRKKVNAKWGVELEPEAIFCVPRASETPKW